MIKQTNKLSDLIGEVVTVVETKFDYWIVAATDEEVCLKSRIDGKLSVRNIKQTRMYKKSDEI